MTTIGVLALQGDFREHVHMIQRLGAEAMPIRLPQQLHQIDGIIIPGGESTTIGKLMVEYTMVEPLHRRIAAGMPTWGTCAGMILLAKSTDNALDGQPLLASMDIHVCRNAFGSQRESFSTEMVIPVLGKEPYRAVFIRAPVVLSAGPEVEILAQLADRDNAIVAVRQNHMLGTAFHPEVTNDLRFHRYFLDIVEHSTYTASS